MPGLPPFSTMSQYILGLSSSIGAAACGPRRCGTLYCGVKWNRYLADCSDGAGAKSEDEVITTPFSFIATAEAIVLLGAMPFTLMLILLHTISILQKLKYLFHHAQRQLFLWPLWTTSRFFCN